ncbi:MAG: tRNA (N6-isopentenyl adenosine(37)-C2)-methylthiotransferase MiaB, partial [Actinobacteria bacterium]|nr:tRNA (N6-isopentenyl adenosine(37)-C2)-methylthiotransferase MiaB [Actinomycetota bacterium]
MTEQGSTEQGSTEQEQALSGPGKSGTYTLLTYGCQMNEHDSETIAGILREMGYTEASSLEESDLILLIPCSIRESAVEKIFGKAGELKRLKYTNPDLLIGICGCLPQHEGAVEKIRRRAPHVDLVFGTHNLYRLPVLIAKAREEGEAVVEVWESEGEVVENLPIRRVEGIKA